MENGATQVLTRSGGRAEIGADAVGELKAGLGGDVLVSGDGALSEIRAPFNAMKLELPALAVRCESTDDVVAAVNFARENDLLVGVRGGGHSVAGLSTVADGMLIDLSAMNGVEVDADAKRVTAGGGALWGEVDEATQKHGLATPGGVVSDTGIAGLTLGGGYGWLRRMYGLSCDSLVEAEVVCADGSVRTASADSEPDLFWAIRGGGGNFGIVTSFTFELYEVGPEVAFSATFYPLEEIGQVMRGWREYAEKAPNEVTSVVVTITFPMNPEMPEAVHDRPVAIVGGVYAGSDVEKGMELTKPLRELGTPLFDMSGPTPYVGVQTGFDPLFPRAEHRAYWKSMYVDELSDDAIDTIAARALERPAPMTLVNTFLMGGAIADVDPEATAFSERSPRYMVSIDGLWGDDSQSDEVIAWVRSTWEAVSEFGTGAVYLNFTGLDDETPDAGVDSAFGRNMARLAKIKAQYDPDNLFRVNNNIVPAG